MHEDQYVVDFECTNQCQYYSKFFKTYEEAYDCMLKHVQLISDHYKPYIVKRTCGRGGVQLVIRFPDSLYICKGNEIEVNWRIYHL